MFWLVVPVVASLVPVVEVPPWCRWLPTWCQWWRCLPGAGGCLPGAGGGGASLVQVVEVPTWCRWLHTWCQWWRCLPGAGGCLDPRPHIHSRTRRRVHARLPSAAALSLVNRSCKESLLDAIALIVNYLGIPLGMAFTGWYSS